MNPSTTENNWDNKLNQTKDLVFNGTKNKFIVEDGEWNNADGTWSTQI